VFEKRKQRLPIVGQDEARGPHVSRGDCGQGLQGGLVGGLKLGTGEEAPLGTIEMLDDLIAIAERDAAKSNGPDLLGARSTTASNLLVLSPTILGRKTAVHLVPSKCMPVWPTAQMSAGEDAETECRSFW
jgi:hypothetical protein